MAAGLGAIGSILGGAGQIAGGFAGAEASEEATRTNFMINLLNFFQREAERQSAWELAREVRYDQKKGMRDAQGNEMYFDPSKGWVTQLSPEQEALQKGQNREQERVLNHDLPLRRDAMLANLRAAMEDRFMADGIRDEMGQQQERVSDTQARMRAAMSTGVNEQWDELQSQALNKAIRMGSSNIGAILKDLSSGRLKAQSEGTMRANAAGETLNAQVNGNRRGQLANLYNMFATRGAQNPTASYQPQNISQGPNAMVQNAAQLSATGDSATINAAGKKGGTVDYVQPDYGYANALSTAGSSVADMFKNIAGAVGGRGVNARTDNAGW